MDMLKYLGQYATGNRRESQIILALFLASYLPLHEDSDPLGGGVWWLYNKLNFCSHLENKLSGARSPMELDKEQSESLIDNMPCYGMVAKIALQKENCLNNNKLNNVCCMRRIFFNFLAFLSVIDWIGLDAMKQLQLPSVVRL
ncbi:hypothetical protein T09_5083 [Trichinella sp. T9]|nr:hypothetical protein T09_5083 [Trichinella sp. T9]